MAALFTVAKISVLLALRKIIDLFINCIPPTQRFVTQFSPIHVGGRNAWRSPQNVCAGGLYQTSSLHSRWVPSSFPCMYHLLKRFYFFNLVTNSITINKRGVTLLTQDRKQIWGFPQRKCQRCQWRGWIFYSSSDVVCARACRLSLIISSVGS